MKCSFCGGEVPSTSLSCPFCGRENPEGIAFQKEITEKIEKNKLLKVFLIKQKTPKLVQKMLTRIWVILILLNVVLLFFSFAIFLWAGQEAERVPVKGSYAEQFIDEFHISGNWEYNQFSESMQEIMEAIEKKEMPGDYKVEYLVENAYDVVAENTNSPSDKEYEDAEECIMVVNAFFRGYLGFNEEEMIFLMPDENGEYSYFLDYDKKEAAIQLVWEKLEVLIQ